MYLKTFHTANKRVIQSAKLARSNQYKKKKKLKNNKGKEKSYQSAY